MLPPRAYIFFGLNAVRVLSIVSLILVFSSSIFVMVTNIKAVNAFEANKGNSTLQRVATDNSTLLHFMEDCDYIQGSTVPNQPAGVFWAVVSSLLIIFQTIILLLSEVGWPAAFFDRFFPVLGSNFGVGALGIFQCLIGAQILSHHVDKFTLVSAFFLFALGCLNMFLGLIFRESAKEKRSVTSWRAEAKGILPSTNDNRPVFVNVNPSYVSSVFSGNEKAKEADDFGTWSSGSSTEKPSYGFGRQGEKAAGMKGFLIQKPAEALPRYAAPPASVPRYSTRTSTSSFASPQTYRETIQSSLPGSRPESEIYQDAPVFRSSPTAL